MKITPTEIDDLLAQARRKGLTFTVRGVGGVIVEANTPTAKESAPANDEPAKPTLLPSAFVPPNVWLVGVETRSESNKRTWQDRSRRTIAARRAVSALFGKTLSALAPFAEHYHAGGSLRIVFTRLAPTKLDRGNVSVALKAVEDALALMLGADDGDARWLASYEQEKSDRYGVRIEMGKP